MSSKVSLRPWDGYDAYLFDIDGTLIHCKDAVHYFAFCEALTTLAGRPLNLDGVVAHGNTDVGILRDALRLAGIADAVWRPRLAEARNEMCSHVVRYAEDLQVEVLPGVQEVLQHLRARGAMLGVATGNLLKIGKQKLQRGGLLGCFHFGGYSDAHEDRSAVFAAALQQARTHAGATASVCVVGDTPADIQAAHANGLPVIAVSTGVYTREQLAEHKPEYLVGSLLDLLVAMDDD